MLSSIDVENFRCVERAHLEFDPRATGIVGPNASGKTTLLEALYFLGHGRSFRGAQRARLLRTGTQFLRVVGALQNGSTSALLGVEYRGEALQIRLAGRTLSGFSEIAQRLPIQVIDPGVHRMIEEGSARRRRLLDWGVFHVEHDYLPIWRRYQRALQQRNAALRGGASWPLVSAWDLELSTCAELLHDRRRAYFEAFGAEFSRWAERLVGTGVRMDYRRGWRADATLAQVLVETGTRDRRVKTTSVGPHRADLVLTVDGVPARERISRGQQKMLASAVVLAAVALRAKVDESPSCLLLDDPAAELDVDNLGKFLSAVCDLPAQLIVTAVSSAGLEGLPIGRRFHVEQGRVSPML